MNPFAIFMAVMVPLASFFSLMSGKWDKVKVKAGNWDKEMAESWDSARNLRPCVGRRDPACKYHDADKVAR